MWVVAAAASAADLFARIPDGDLPAIISVPPQMEHLAGDQIRFRDLIDAHHMLLPETIREQAVNDRYDKANRVFETPPATSSEADPDRMQPDYSQPAVGEMDTPRASRELIASLPPDSHLRARDDAAAATSEIVDAMEDRAATPTDDNGNDIRTVGWDTLSVRDPPTEFDAFELLGFTGWWFTLYGSPSPDEIELSGRGDRSPYLYRATATVVYCGSVVFECQLETHPDEGLSIDIHQEGYLPQSVRDTLRNYVTSRSPIPRESPMRNEDNPYRTAPIEPHGS
ncbi:hypothetical protein [Halorubrum laminariae]|uniref:Uncharacterized protein n=1 Tax=Halorubrum laminariae TaxID=1433523 RepID=A0ABD6C5P0_9EURY|nr:hypothetical protein [Halorubrum laminariae]